MNETIETPISDHALSESLKLVTAEQVTKHFISVCRQLETERRRLTDSLQEYLDDESMRAKANPEEPRLHSPGRLARQYKALRALGLVPFEEVASDTFRTTDTLVYATRPVVVGERHFESYEVVCECTSVTVAKEFCFALNAGGNPLPPRVATEGLPDTPGAVSGRYKVVAGSHSGHRCCFSQTVVDMATPVIINGEHLKDKYQVLCECDDAADAQAICDALNRNSSQATADPPDAALLSDEEMVVMKGLVTAWNAFVKLESLHPDETVEFRRSIHAAQHIIMARPVQRQFNLKNEHPSEPK